MSHIRLSLAAGVLAALISTGVAGAQAPASPPDSRSAPQASTPATEPSATTKVEKWTTKEWDAAKTKWAKDKARWSDCRQQSADQKLTGRKSWAFLYQCMT